MVSKRNYSGCVTSKLTKSSWPDIEMRGRVSLLSKGEGFLFSANEFSGFVHSLRVSNMYCSLWISIGAGELHIKF